jgi:enoyl-CoA hydratase/carnithine racemase
LPTGVSLEKREGSAVLSVEGRTNLNLLGRKVFESLSQRIDQCCEDPEVRAIVLRGSGERAFSAGVDLHEMKDLAPLEAESFIRTLHTAARKLLTAPLPVVAAVRGPCLGGALELALACDIRIAAEDAIFGLPEVRVGLPSVIEASLLPRTVGLGRARAMLLTGQSVEAEEALRIGLIDRLVSRAELEGAVSETANGFLGMSPYVLSTQKEIVAKWLEMGEEEAAEYSIKAFALCFATSHPHEAMTAFLEKRPPRFKTPL